MLTADQVKLAYRALLGREPENQEAIWTWLRLAPDLESLCVALCDSEEFLHRVFKQHFTRIVTFLQPGAPIRVESQVEPDVLERMLERVKETWSRLAQSEPFWSVLSAEQFRGENFERYSQVFWESGKSDVDVLNRWLARNQLGPFGATHTCCEYGCGTGRVTRWLAAQFSRVTALDVSSAHIALAREHVESVGLANTTFMEVKSLALPLVIEPVDVLFCRIVLQHNPPPIIALLIEQFFRWLKPGGVAFFQVPTYSASYEFEAGKYIAQPLPLGFEMHLLPQREIFAIAKRQRCSLVEVEPDDCVAWRDWISNTFLFQKTI